MSKISTDLAYLADKDTQRFAYLDALLSKIGTAGALTALGATSNLVGVDGTASNAAPLVGTEARLDAIEAKVDAIISALKG